MLCDRMENGDHAEERFSAAMQLLALGEAAKAAQGLGQLLNQPVGELRTRIAVQLGRMGEAAFEAFPALVRAAVDRLDDGLSLAAVETLNTIDPENLIGAPQMVRLLRRRVLKMWRGGAFLRVSVDEALRVRLIEALAINGRYCEDAWFELEHLASATTGRTQEVIRETLRIYAEEEEKDD